MIGAIPMLLWCPACCARHVDVGSFATRPHHTHACQECGMVWRPALVCTVGVQFLPGFRDSEETSLAAFDLAAAERAASTRGAGAVPCVYCGAPQTSLNETLDEVQPLCHACYKMPQDGGVSCEVIRAKLGRDSARGAS